MLKVLSLVQRPWNWHYNVFFLTDVVVEWN